MTEPGGFPTFPITPGAAWTVKLPEPYAARADWAIQVAMAAIEQAGADERLTSAGIHLAAALHDLRARVTR